MFLRSPDLKNRDKIESGLRLVAWEITRSCNLACDHCRASSEMGPYPGELTTEESLRLIEDIAAFSSPIVILTGGEPLMRKDVSEIARAGTELGLRMVLATNGTLLTRERARELLGAGIKRVSISIDGKDAKSHDDLRGVPGAFAGAVFGVESAKAEGLPFQINTTITKRNMGELSEIEDLVRRLGAVAHHLFLLVPTGRGRDMAEDSLDGEEYERILKDICRYEREAPHEVKVTCAPQYMRIKRETAAIDGVDIDSKGRGDKPAHGHPGGSGDLSASTRGCLGGISFLFISHGGDTQPCGYLEVSGGSVRERPIREIWEKSELFLRLRDYSLLTGKCGRCEYVDVCGGCRARAYYHHGDYLAPEPLCPYVPAKLKKGR
ncbi:MAG: radical SAM protein [Deltaproteobacteria bacterium]|uniref:Radical SAM protein n=1 Tax=Candidatus Zymogenus saltonus TaxID=2844893 RepID=A0A9D8PLZ8_9DELT|nr:radical SAM protein [Candidatus Zymogenus saltonus]